MKKKEFVVVNSFLLLLGLAFGYLTFRLSVNQSPLDSSKPVVTAQEKAMENQVGNCTKQQPLGLTNFNDPHLKKLADYQAACNSFVTNKLMFFTGFSGDVNEANQNAEVIAQKLKDFAAAHVSPIVIAEPYVGNQAMSYKTYLTGKYDAGMSQFFKKLKELGVTDEMMGMWVPFPESNTPSWNNKDTEPRDFALCVNKYLHKMKEYFPNAKGSILLNATTYDPNDAGWENGNYYSFSEYVGLIDKDLVSSFGIQGFPWVSNAQQPKRTIFKASEFIQPDLAIGAAQSLRIRDIWINTGTFASKYTQDPTKRVEVSINERKALLNGILEMADYIHNYQENEYRISINLFSEDKSDTNEQTDWSYFQNVESTSVLKEFLVSAEQKQIPISLYDKAKWQLK